ncbi:integrase, catalytic region, zinc finger, CCHC-type containing protein [Tanacetum coccineum]
MMNTKCNHSKGDMKVEAKSSSLSSCGKFIEVVIMLILIGSYYCFIHGYYYSTTVNTTRTKLMLPRRRVNRFTEASGSKPRSNTKNNRILPAKSDNKKKVEAHPRNNKSKLKQENRVDSSISSKLRFGNDHFGAIMGYGDYMIGDSVISRVYYVEGLGHNLFSVGKFCDSDLEVAFRKHSCYIRNEDGVDLLKGSHGSNLYTIFVEDMRKSSPICLLSEASKNKSWLWHRRLNHLNFGTINDLARKDLNGVVERRNRTLVEAARTMLIFSKALMFLWAEVVATAFFGALCYPTNDSEDLGKLKATTDIGIFVGYVPNRKGYRIYNKRTRRIMETIYVQFHELTEQMTPVHISTRPEPILLTPGQISSGLVPNLIPTAPYVPPTKKDLEILFQPMFDEYLEPPSVERPVPPAPVDQVLVVSAGTPSSTTIDQDAPSISHSPSSSVVQPPILHQGVAAGPTIKYNPFAQAKKIPL